MPTTPVPGDNSIETNAVSNALTALLNTGSSVISESRFISCSRLWKDKCNEFNKPEPLVFVFQASSSRCGTNDSRTSARRALKCGLVNNPV
ncbi:unnamed protein product [Schistosoma margrebowiei]|uniref:Uncharacterized protein n=1 Tax=Schistosoma margrebowiei TaxID=48269 RepID=A0A3P7WS25_9TREM|nr:unnamed protein product [Schistosoma margrebowiei]